MMRRLLGSLAALGLAAGLTAAAGPAADAHTDDGGSDAASSTGNARSYYGSPAVDLRVAHLTTSRFHNLEAAKRAGYTVVFQDRLGFTCISDIPTPGMPSMGAMGVHYVNPAYIGSTDPAHPAAVLYQPGPGGGNTLVGLEYLVVEPKQPKAPASFGERFMFTPAGDVTVNRFMPDAFYSLHVWAWEHNPSGLYEMWNPRVHCPA
ncbi:MAG: hypothetical protein ABI890_16400 [Lapillicoccus sp.]